MEPVTNVSVGSPSPVVLAQSLNHLGKGCIEQQAGLDQLQRPLPAPGFMLLSSFWHGPPQDQDPGPLPYGLSGSKGSGDVVMTGRATTHILLAILSTN